MNIEPLEMNMDVEEDDFLSGGNQIQKRLSQFLQEKGRKRHFEVFSTKNNSSLRNTVLKKSLKTNENDVEDSIVIDQGYFVQFIDTKEKRHKKHRKHNHHHKKKKKKKRISLEMTSEESDFLESPLSPNSPTFVDQDENMLEAFENATKDLPDTFNTQITSIDTFSKQTQVTRPRILGVPFNNSQNLLKNSFQRANSFHISSENFKKLMKEKTPKISKHRSFSNSQIKLELAIERNPRNRQCNTISHKTLLRALIKGNKKIFLIDCRFPFEYQGGTIKGAVNIFDPEMIKPYFFINPEKFAGYCLIFFCEFSSKRGPSMYDTIRKTDRQVNEENYPRLTYPQIFLLEGGYSKFYEYANRKNYSRFCTPNQYVMMEDPKYSQVMRKYYHLFEKAKKAQKHQFSRRRAKSSRHILNKSNSFRLSSGWNRNAF